MAAVFGARQIRMKEHKLPPVLACDVDAILQDLDAMNANKKLGDDIAAQTEGSVAESRVEKLRFKMKVVDILACLIGFFGIFIATVEYEYYYSDNGKERYTRASFANVMRAMVSISTGVLIIVIIIRNIFDFHYQKLKNPYTYDIPFYKSIQLKLMVIEFFICGVHMPPGFDYTFEVSQMDRTFTYSLCMIMLNLMYLRIYLLFRGFAAVSKWKKLQAEKCCESESCEATTTFALKAFMKEMPYTSLGVLVVSTVVVFGLVIRNFEYPVYYQCEEGCQDWSFFWNGMWYTIITMTTVGYGDFFAVTHMGRCMAVVVVFLGVYLSSLIILALTVSSTMEPKEVNAYNIVFRLKAKEDLRIKAATVVTHFAKIISLKRKIRGNNSRTGFYKKELEQLQSRLAISLEIFSETRNSIGKMDVGPEELLRQLNEKFERDFKDTKAILKSILQLDKQLTLMECNNHIVFDALVESIAYTRELKKQYQLMESPQKQQPALI